MTGVVTTQTETDLQGWTVVSASEEEIILEGPTRKEEPRRRRVVVNARTVNFGEDAELTYRERESS